MPLPWQPLPPIITRRRAVILVADALGHAELARRFEQQADAMRLDRRLGEVSSWNLMKDVTPEASSPVIAFNGKLVHAAYLPTYVPPGIPVVRTLSWNAAAVTALHRRSPFGGVRPADHAGALVDEKYGDPLHHSEYGYDLHEPRGSIGHWLMALARVALSWETLPMTRPGVGRSGRPSSPDVKGILRILLQLIEKSRPKEKIVIESGPCLALLLWTDGHGHPLWRNGKIVVDPRPDPTAIPGIPIVEEIEPWVTTGNAIRGMAKAIRNLSRTRPQEYAAKQARRVGEDPGQT